MENTVEYLVVINSLTIRLFATPTTFFAARDTVANTRVVAQTDLKKCANMSKGITIVLFTLTPKYPIPCESDRQ
jgi:hypothetical protein